MEGSIFGLPLSSVVRLHGFSSHVILAFEDAQGIQTFSREQTGDTDNTDDTVDRDGTDNTDDTYDIDDEDNTGDTDDADDTDDIDDADYLYDTKSTTSTEWGICGDLG